MVATHEQLNAEVDRQFFEQHPSAPKKLDAHDPAQQHFVTAWNQIRDRTANAWTDHYLREFYPAMPERLDPNNPAHHEYVEYWNDLHHQMTTGQPGRWSWSAPPQQATPQAAQGATPAQPAAQAPQHGATEAGQHAGAQSAQHAAQAPQHTAAPAAQHATQAAHDQHGNVAVGVAAQQAVAVEGAQVAASSGWLYIDLCVCTKGVDGVNDLKGYEVWAQPIGTDNWYPTNEPTTGGRINAFFTDVLVQPEQGLLLHYRATESAILPELEGQISCEGAEYANGRNWLRVDLCQEMQVTTVEAASVDEALQHAGGSYPGSAYLDERQRNATDHPEGERRSYEVWVGLPTVKR